MPLKRSGLALSGRGWLRTQSRGLETNYRNLRRSFMARKPPLLIPRSAAHCVGTLWGQNWKLITGKAFMLEPGQVVGDGERM